MPQKHNRKLIGWQDGRMCAHLLLDSHTQCRVQFPLWMYLSKFKKLLRQANFVQTNLQQKN